MDRYGNQPFPFGDGRFVERVGHGGGPSDLAWVIFSLLLVLLLLAIASLALEAYFRSQRPGPFTKWLSPGMTPGRPFPGGRALAVLDVRYARGEISRDEFLQARADLGGAPCEGDDEAPTEVVPPEPPARGRRKEEPES